MRHTGSTRHVRRVLPHAQLARVEVPDVRFLTWCTTPRHENQLCTRFTAQLIADVLQFHAARGAWQLHAVVLMPDHVHVLASVPGGTDLRRLVIGCKRFIATRSTIRWQRDFFEHRLRRHEHFDQKVEYLRQNPVRAGLVDDAGDWPYFWIW